MIEAIQFTSFSEFLNMGGYAFNVWSVYLLFAVFLSVNLLSPVLKRKQIMRNLHRRVTLSGSSAGSSQESTNNLSETGTVGETQ